MKAWCPDCRTMSEVVDRFLEDTGDSATVVRLSVVTVLACDHTTEDQLGERPSPLRQAGPPRAMALAARDPWGEA